VANNTNRNSGLLVVALIAGVIAVAAIIWGFTQSNAKSQLKAENQVMTEQMDELAQLRTDLEQEVDSLREEYEYLASDNEMLSGNLKDTEAKLVRTERALRNAKNAAAGESNNLKAQIEELLAAKSELEMNIVQLQAENDSLRVRTGQLEQDLQVSEQDRESLANLNKTIQEEVKRLTLANFKASGFKVNTLQRKGKMEVRAKRVKTVEVTFDLASVPAEYQGVRPIYLTITDESGTPIQTESPVMADIVVNGQEMSLVAVEAKEVNIGTSQRLSFTHEVNEKMEAGLYQASVYTDIGLLGASSFQLR